jgi:TonB family protein
MRIERRSTCRRLRLTLLPGAACACLVLAEPSSAQAPTSISGLVRDSAAGIGLFGVEVSLEGTARRALTDEQGAFRLLAPADAALTLRVRRLGFRPRLVTVSGPADQVQVQLVATAQSLVPVVVRVERGSYTGRLTGYYQRLERRTQGQFITRADLERDRPAQLTDMLQRSPGIRITRGRPGAQSVRMRGRDCRPLIWLDGAPMSAGEVDLDSFSPGSLEGIEMYLGSANAPSRYHAARGQSECGTILLWSRETMKGPQATGRAVTPDELEVLLRSSSVFTSDQVDVPVALDAAGGWAVSYPPTMIASGATGTVIAEFVVDTLGRVEWDNFGIVASTHVLFSEAVREAVGGAQFRPALRKGQRVRQVVHQPFEFHLSPETR